MKTSAVGTRHEPLCPKCGRGLERVRQTSGCLNDDQFDAIKAGDYFADECPESDCAGAASGVTPAYRYFGEIEGSP